MLVFVRSQNLETDGRLANHIAFCRYSKIDFRVIEWDRIGTAAPIDEYTYRYSNPLRHDSGSLRLAIYKRIGFAFFVLKTLRSLKGGKVWYCDLDMSWTLFLISRNWRIISDVYDHMSVIRNSRILRWYENLCYSRSSKIIVVSEKRKKELISARFQTKTHIVHNLVLDYRE